MACGSDRKRLLLFEPSQEAAWEEQDLPFGCGERDQAKMIICLLSRGNNGVTTSLLSPYPQITFFFFVLILSYLMSADSS